MRQLIFILLAIIGVSQAQTIQYIGAPTTTVISRGNFRTDSIFYLPKRTKLPTDTAALRYQISDSSLYAWTGSQWRKVGADADTLVYSTRAWRQKGDDSLAARINLKVNISDTASMLTPYLRKGDTASMLSPYYRSAAASAALALKLNISDTSSMLGNYVRHAGYGLTKSGQSFLVDTLNIATRAWRQKGLDSLAALEVSGSGTTNYIPKFTASSTIGNSQIFDNGTNVGVGTASPLVKLDIVGSAGTVVRTKGGTGSAQGSAYYVQLAGSTSTLSAFGDRANIFGGTVDQFASIYTGSSIPLTFDVNSAERMRIFANGRVFIGASPTDAGYQLDVNGTLRSVNGANFATTSGNVGIGTASPQQILHANATTGAYIQLSRTAQGGTTSPFGGIYFGDGTTFQEAAILSSADGNVVSGNMAFYTRAAAGSLLEGFRVNSTQEMLVGGGSDAGDYKLQVAGTIYANNPSSVALQIGGGQAVRTTGALYIDYGTAGSGDLVFRGGSGFASVLTATNAGEVLVNTGTDAGDYKLQVVGNARIGTGKLDIASNTVYGLGVARSGTSEVAGQIYNSSGILYFGAESSTGGGIFSGSSAYAGVIGTGANYPLQFAVNNITRGGFSTSGNLLLGFTTDSYFLKLQVNGSIFSNNQFFGQGANAQLSIDSSTNISPLYVSAHSLTGTSAQAMLYSSTTWNTTGNPSLLDLNVTNTASGATSNYIKITDGTNTFRVTKAAEVVTAAPSGGSIKPWKLGEAATVSPTSPNRTIRVEIDGTVYYLHAKTTND